MKFIQILRHYFGGPIARIVGALAALVVFLLVVLWIGNPYLKDDEGNAAPAWTAPTTVPPATSTAPVAPLPPGFPSMTYPPPMPEVADGEPQPVPTKFGLTYTVPSENWDADNGTVIGWTDSQGTISYGAASRYRHTFCPEVKGASLAKVAATGRTGTDLDSAARDEVAKANRIFADEKTGRIPHVEIRGPIALEVSGRPAVRYTAVVTDIPVTPCAPEEAHFDIIATPGYSNAEVMLLMVEHHRGHEDSLTDDDVDAIIGSLQRTDD